MITLYLEKCEHEITQKEYDSIIFATDLYRIPCSCGNHALCIHGYYYRNIKNTQGTIKLRILRVKCKCCGKTHAVFISQIVPFSNIQLNDQIRMIKDDHIDELLEEKPTIDVQHIHRIRNNYRKQFKERLIAFSLNIDNDIIPNCFKYFERNFMQIKWGLNILFL